MTGDTIEWELIRNHASDLLTQDLVLGGFYKHCDMAHYGATFKTPSVKYEQASGNIFWSKAHMDAMRTMELPPSTARTLIAEIKEALASYKEYVEEFKNKAAVAGKDAELVREWFERTLQVIPLVAYFVFEESLSKKLEQEGLSIHDIPSQKTDVITVSEAIAQLHAAYKDDMASPQLAEEIAALVTRYGYLGMKYFSGAPWSAEDVRQMVIHSRSTPKETRAVTSKSETVEFLGELLHLRTVKWELMCYSISILREYIMKNFGEVRYDDLLQHSIEEVLDILTGKTAKKHTNFVLTIDERGYSLRDVDGTAEMSAARDESEVRGTVAYKGKIRGTAKLVFSPKDAQKIGEGDILIATMSTPDFLPAMQRAAAFVTDIGGITSHAAIVAREMKKPCVIGTKIATQIFKDGDTIEVDAEKGIVRKI